MKNQSFFRLPRLLAGAVLLLALVGPALAQGPSSGGPQPANPATQIPLDGGASLLLAAGVGLAIKRLRRRKT